MEKSTTNICKIAVVGPESTGKSTLAKALAEHYHEPWVPEIAREYIATLKRPYHLNDITLIAERQLAAENEEIKKAKNYLFCDTTLLVNKIWASFVFKEVPNKILHLYQPKNYTIHLLCNIDLPWEYDPLREHPNHRRELFELYENDLKQAKANYFIVSGLSDERLQNAIVAMNNIVLPQ